MLVPSRGKGDLLMGDPKQEETESLGPSDEAVMMQMASEKIVHVS